MIIPYTNAWVNNVLSALNTVLREDYMTTTVGMTGYCSNWERDITTAVSIYYLLFVNKNLSCLNICGNNFVYGSDPRQGINNESIQFIKYQ